MFKPALLIAALASAGLTLSAPALAACEGQPLDKELITYIRTWPLGSTPKDMDAGERWNADSIDGCKLTRLNLSFGLIRNGTEVYIKDLEAQPTSDKSGTIAPFANMWDEVAKLQARYPHLKINLSMGGWGADGFSDMAMKPETRKAFIDNVLAIVAKHKLDGVDIDWEYPVGPDWGVPISTHPKDRDNYPALLEELKAAMDKVEGTLGKDLTLSVAVPGSTWFGMKNNLPRIAKAVDFLKVMSYDYYGGWSKTTGHASNLGQRTDDPAWGGWSTRQSMKAYTDWGIDPAKLIMGVAFYGRAWQGVDSKDNGLFQSHKGGIYEDGLTWTDIKSKFLDQNGFVRHWDDTAKAPWLYNGDVFITYEDPQGLRDKVAYLKENNFGGIMVWEYSHDMSGELLGVLHEEMGK